MYAQPNHIGRRREHLDEEAPEQQNQHHQNRRNRNADLHAGFRAFLHALKLFCADILACERRHRRAEGEVRHHRKAVHTHDNRGNRDNRGAEAVRQRLHDDHRHGKDRLRQAAGQAEADKLRQKRPARPERAQPHMQHVAHQKQTDQAQYAGNSLRDNRRPRGARNAHVKGSDKPNIQNNIQAARDHEKNQRHHGIAQAAQNAGKNVVERAADDAQKQDHEVFARHHVDVLRRLQQRHRPAGDQRAHNHDEYGRHDGRRDRGANGIGEPLFVLCAEILRDHDARADRNAHEQHKQQVENRAAGTDRRQRAVADILPHHDGIHRAVKLLGEIADEQRHRKSDQVAGRVSGGHILCTEKSRDFSCHTKIHPPFV